MNTHPVVVEYSEFISLGIGCSCWPLDAHIQRAVSQSIRSSFEWLSWVPVRELPYFVMVRLWKSTKLKIKLEINKSLILLTLFGENYRFTGGCKKVYKEVGCSPHPVSSSGNILQNYGTRSKLENWQWYHTQSLFRFHQFYMHFCECVYLILWNFITGVDLCNHDHNQDTKLFHHHKNSSWYPIDSTVASLPKPNSW